VDLARLGVDTLKLARKWAAARIALRRTLDSKTASAAEASKAKLDYKSASDALEKQVLLLDKTLRQHGVGGKKNPQPFPWKDLIGLVATGARALEGALGETKTPRPSVAKQDLDEYVVAEVVDVTPKKKG
jgi:hypothetical protein